MIIIDEPKKLTKKESRKITKRVNDFFTRREKFNKEKYGDKEVPYILVMSKVYEGENSYTGNITNQTTEINADSLERELKKAISLIKPYDRKKDKDFKKLRKHVNNMSDEEVEFLFLHTDKVNASDYKPTYIQGIDFFKNKKGKWDIR